ncbi:hypothetical protein K9L63_03355 [Candidatus Gracilibacteria bacterium]|nr:hypothetical protein [Candidatus Gracilibacteria bacterium]
MVEHLQTNFLQDIWQKFVGEKWEKEKDFWLTFEDFHLPAETAQEFQSLHKGWEADNSFLLEMAQVSGKNTESYIVLLQESMDILQEGKTNEAQTSIVRELTGVLDSVCEVCQLQGTNHKEEHDLCLRVCQGNLALSFLLVL